jgi:hypothetical protein
MFAFRGFCLSFLCLSRDGGTSVSWLAYSGEIGHVDVVGAILVVVLILQHSATIWTLISAAGRLGISALSSHQRMIALDS